MKKSIFFLFAIGALFFTSLIFNACSKGSNDENYDITGTWSMPVVLTQTSAHITFTGSPSSGNLTTTSGHIGTYSVNGSDVTWSYKNNLVFTGRFVSSTAMQGTVTDPAGNTDTWTAIKE